jgi:hypothetical protein
MKLEQPQLRKSVAHRQNTNFPPGPAARLDSGVVQRDPLNFMLDFIARYGDLVRYETASGGRLLNWPPMLTCCAGRDNRKPGPTRDAEAGLMTEFL